MNEACRMSICVCCDKSVNTENQAYFSGETLIVRRNADDEGFHWLFTT